MTIPLITVPGSRGSVRLAPRERSDHPLDHGGFEAAIVADPNPMPRLRLFRWLWPSSNGGPN